ncbi:MAG: hypothetical protein QG580_408 [Patescibacteria group bacterium]|jgi:hypothetical protein|nr:hypothetical protein [Patescibacteria group bacterium]
MAENLIYLTGFFILIVISLIIIIIKLDKRISKLLEGKNAKTLEDTLLHVINEIKRMNQLEVENDKIIKDINKRLKTSITGVGVVRFNPFTNSGGNQSFAITLLNEHGDGVIISTLYGRERTSVFAKPIKKYKSEFELTKEEAESLAQAS